MFIDMNLKALFEEHKVSMFQQEHDGKSILTFTKFVEEVMYPLTMDFHGNLDDAFTHVMGVLSMASGDTAAYCEYYGIDLANGMEALMYQKGVVQKLCSFFPSGALLKTMSDIRSTLMDERGFEAKDGAEAPCATTPLSA